MLLRAVLTTGPAAGPVPPSAVTLVVGGGLQMFWIVVYNVAQVSFRQRLCPPALLGRMNASVRFLVWGGMPLGGLVGGFLGTHLGVVETLWVAVAGTVLASLPVLASPLVRMRELPGPESPATPMTP